MPYMYYIEHPYMDGRGSHCNQIVTKFILKYIKRIENIAIDRIPELFAIKGIY